MKIFMEIVNIEIRTFEEMIHALRSCREKLESIQSVHTEKRLNEWLDNQDVCTILNISSRTLQTLRSNGTLSYSQIDRKTYYRKQDVMRLLNITKRKEKK